MRDRYMQLGACATSTGMMADGPGVQYATYVIGDVAMQLQVMLKARDNRMIATPKATAGNIETILTVHPSFAGKIRYDEMSYRTYVYGTLPWGAASRGDRRPLSNADLSQLKIWIEETLGVSVGDTQLLDGMTAAAHSMSVHPVREYMASLPAWDGCDRVSHMLHDTLGACDDDWTATATRLWLREAYWRVMMPGCQADYTMLLIGSPGLGKSTLMRRLAHDDTWATDLKDDLSSRQAIEDIQGKWLVELGELAAVRKAHDIEAVKGWLTSRCDDYRQPYDRFAESHPRQCMMWATSNCTTAIPDDDGMRRRLLPVDVGVSMPDNRINIFADEFEEYVDQLWAQIVAEERETLESGARPKLVLSGDETKLQIAHTSAHTPDDYRVGIIADWLDGHSTRGERVCAVQIASQALGLDDTEIARRRTLIVPDIMRIMDRMPGWVRGAKRGRVNGYGPQRYWEYIR